MTVKEVPVGHIFRLSTCACFFRRTDEEHIIAVHRCLGHARTGSGHRMWGVNPIWIGAAASLHVIYDPLAAELERQK